MTGDARPRFFITLCSRSRCGAREAMTVGCKPTRTLSTKIEINQNQNVASPSLIRDSGILQELPCRFTTYRHCFARVAPAPRAKLIDSKIQRIVEARRPSRIAGLRGSSLRFPPIGATKPEVPRQIGEQDASLTHVASRRARAVRAKCRLAGLTSLKSRAAISISINFDAPL